MKANYKIITSLTGAILLVVLGAIVSFWTFGQIEQSTRMRMQTTAILTKTDSLLASLTDAESGMRGYLLTGDIEYLDSYMIVKDSFAGRLEELQQLGTDSLTRQHIDALTPLVKARLAFIEQVLVLYTNRDTAAALELVRSGEGKRLMDLVRTEIASINQVETDILAQREAKFESNMRQMFLIILISSMLVLLLALSFTFLVYRETQQRLKNLVHIETQHFLEIQEEANKQLQRVNASLRISEEKLAVTLNSIGDGVVATDAEGRVVILNPLAEQLTGWTVEQAAGRPVDEIFQIINHATRERAVVPVMETLAHGTLHGLANHTILIARDGSECAIADSCAPIRDRDGLIVGAVLVFRDVTERNLLDQALQEKNVELEMAKSVAEKANQAKSEFLSSMSHELRSPLNAILGFAQLMESDSPAPSQVQKQSIDQISQAGWHLLNLINEVLDLTKIESGQVPLSPEPVSLIEVMQECQSMVEPQAQQRGIQLIFPKNSPPTFVRADRTRMKQVLINLLSNAIKYNIAHGTVDVKFNEITPGRIRVSIQDTGRGLSPVQVAQLFQAFNRLGQESSGVEGTGIGLVVARRLVELMGGVMGVESTVGMGSVFWFELLSVGEPHFSLDVNEHITHKTIQPDLPQGTPLRTVLYVEDNPANLKLVEKIFERRHDLRLLSASNGHKGIEFARKSCPDMILMDINLPDINGFEVLKILQTDPATACIPVVAISANAMPRDIKKGLDVGFFRYITKPIKISEFLEALDETLKYARENESNTNQETGKQ